MCGAGVRGARGGSGLGFRVYAVFHGPDACFD